MRLFIHSEIESFSEVGEGTRRRGHERGEMGDRNGAFDEVAIGADQTTAVDAVGVVDAISTDTADAAVAVLAAAVATGADVTAAAVAAAGGVAAAPPAPSAVPQCGLGAQMYSLTGDALDDDDEA